MKILLDTHNPLFLKSENKKITEIGKIFRHPIILQFAEKEYKSPCILGSIPTIKNLEKLLENDTFKIFFIDGDCDLLFTLKDKYSLQVELVYFLSESDTLPKEIISIKEFKVTIANYWYDLIDFYSNMFRNRKEGINAFIKAGYDLDEKHLAEYKLL